MITNDPQTPLDLTATNPVQNNGEANKTSSKNQETTQLSNQGKTNLNAGVLTVDQLIGTLSKSLSSQKGDSMKFVMDNLAKLKKHFSQMHKGDKQGECAHLNLLNQEHEPIFLIKKNTSPENATIVRITPNNTNKPVDKILSLSAGILAPKNTNEHTPEEFLLVDYLTQTEPKALPSKGKTYSDDDVTRQLHDPQESKKFFNPQDSSQLMQQVYKTLKAGNQSAT